MTDAVITDSSAGNGNTQAERTALSDQRMFEMAIELVNERGTAKTTLKDIGEGAGYSRGLASYRFGSKDGLWMELFARFDDIWKAHLSQYLTGKQGLAALEAAIQAQRDIFRACRPEYCSCNCISSIQSNRARTRPIVAGFGSRSCYR